MTDVAGAVVSALTGDGELGHHRLDGMANAFTAMTDVAGAVVSALTGETGRSRQGNNANRRNDCNWDKFTHVLYSSGL